MKLQQMTFGSRDILQMTVFSLVVVLGPLLLYPLAFDINLDIGFGGLLALESLYYMIVLSFLNSGSGIMATLLGAALSVLYRYFLATLFAIMIAAPGDVSFGDALRLGMTGYWPAIAVFALSSPFVMINLVRWAIDSLDTNEEVEIRPKRALGAPSRVIGGPGGSSASFATEAAQAPYFPHAEAESPKSETEEYAFGSDDERASNDASAFERAMDYLAMIGSVRVAAVVDFDGCEVASFARDGYVSAEWSPFALNMFDTNAEIFSRHGQDAPLRIETTYENLRVECRLVGIFFVLVVAERSDEEQIRVRITQVCDMIEKYVTERYSPELIANMEGSDVLSPE